MLKNICIIIQLILFFSVAVGLGWKSIFEPKPTKVVEARATPDYGVSAKKFRQAKNRSTRGGQLGTTLLSTSASLLTLELFLCSPNQNSMTTRSARLPKSLKGSVTLASALSLPGP